MREEHQEGGSRKRVPRPAALTAGVLNLSDLETEKYSKESQVMMKARLYMSNAG